MDNNIRDISSGQIRDAVEKLCLQANFSLPGDIRDALGRGIVTEKSELGRSVLGELCENFKLAEETSCPMCQDTGMVIVFAELGRDAHITGDPVEAINEGVRRAYERGYLRKSIVRDPIRRENSGDNTPAVIHWELTEGDRLTIRLSPKGFGSENMSALRMLKPSDGLEGVKNFIADTAVNAGPNACPPIIIGAGVGGTMEKAALMAKKALTRNISQRNPDGFWADIETELMDRINRSGLGPSGLGGTTTCLGVMIDTYPTHIAGLPVAVNISCYATRHAEVIL